MKRYSYSKAYVVLYTTSYLWSVEAVHIGCPNGLRDLDKESLACRKVLEQPAEA